MLDEVYVWMEEYCGVSYDFKEAIQEVSGTQAFISPFEWRITLELVLEHLNEAIDAIDEHWRGLPEDLPNRTEMKRMFTQSTLMLILQNINSVCSQMNIEPPQNISTIDQLSNAIVVIADLITLLANHSLDEIMNRNLFDEYEESNGEAFFNVLQLHREDMTQLSFTVNEIRQMYYESLDEEDAE